MFFSKKSKAATPASSVVPPVSAPVIPPTTRPVIARPPADIGGDLDLIGLGRAVWQKKTRILTLTVVAATAAFVVVNAMTPRYRSEARLLLESRENVFMRAEADKGTNERAALDPEAVIGQIQIILSRDLARQVIAKEKLNQLPEFDSSPWRTVLSLLGMARDVSAMTREERTLEAFYDRLNVHAIDKSRVIGIDFSSANSDLAASVANTIAQTYLSLQQSTKTDQTRAASSWLATEIAKLRTKVANSEAKVEAYRSRSNLFVGSNNTSLPSQQLSEINSQIATARGQQADLQARARQLRDLIRSGQPIDSSDIANSESMRRLTEQGNALRSQLAEQSTTLLDQHPRIKELRAQIAEVERAKRTEGERLARQLDNDAKLAGDRLQSLTASLDQVKKQASQSNEQDVELRALERDAKSQRELLESYLVKYSEASARDNINAAPPEARIISRASPALKPSYPKKTASVLIAAFAAFMLSAGFTVTAALLATPPAAAGYGYAPSAMPAFVPSVGGAPIAAAVAPQPYAQPFAQPYMPSPPVMPAMMPMPSAPPHVAPLPVSTLEQLALDLRLDGDAGRSVTLAGAGRDVGTTYAAITLARMLAQDATVVLVDLAFDAPNLSVISTDPDAPGIAELVRGTVSFGDIITRDQSSNVHLVATGDIAGDGATLSASPVLATVIEALAQSYNYVVIDAGSVPDVAIERFAPLARCAVLVTADPADPATQAARDRLAQCGFADITLLVGAAQAAAA
ncbi:MAG: lipopolysaccharide biosynthesis protein [Rhodopseudomonas sp.]|nr:lipopolysaccharide biosynthesis protein [Rhodopseudomonas sp.]